jgi:hypothetical protein
LAGQGTPDGGAFKKNDKIRMNNEFWFEFMYDGDHFKDQRLDGRMTKMRLGVGLGCVELGTVVR